MSDFVPRIKISNSQITPHVRVFRHHWPDGRGDTYGVVGKMSFSICRERYVEELRRRFEFIVADVDVVTNPENNLEADEFRVPGMPGEPIIERIYNAIVAGAASRGEIAAATNLPMDSISPVLTTLKLRNRIKKQLSSPQMGTLVKWEAVRVAGKPLEVADVPGDVVAAPPDFVVPALPDLPHIAHVPAQPSQVWDHITEKEPIMNHITHVKLQGDGELVISLRSNPFKQTKADRDLIFQLLNLVDEFGGEKRVGGIA